MPRKKRTTTDNTDLTPGATAVAEPKQPAPSRTAWVDGPPMELPSRSNSQSAPEPDESVQSAQSGEPAQTHGKNWGPAYVARVTTNEFEMGEDRRYKQRVFKFKDRPDEAVIAALKDNGFQYRAAEKSWTIQATPATRELSDQLASEFAGPKHEPQRSR